MPIPSKHASVFALAVLTFVLLQRSAGAQTLLYEQLFTNTSGSAISLSTIGWSAYWGNASAFGNQSTSTSQDSVSSAQGDGRAGTGASPGFLNVVANSANPNTAVFTTFSALDFSSSPTITWITNTNANAGASTEYFMVQSGGLWYASAQAFTPQNNRNAAQLTSDSTGNLSLVQKSFAFNPTASNWNVVNLGPSSLTIGGAAPANLSASITGVGFFIVSGATSTRIDSLQIIPEPSTALMFGTGLVVLLGRIRSKRSGRPRPNFT